MNQDSEKMKKEHRKKDKQVKRSARKDKLMFIEEMAEEAKASTSIHQ